MAEQPSTQTPPASGAPAPQRPPTHPVYEQRQEEDRSHPWIWAVVALVVIGIAVLAYIRKQKPPARPAPPVVVSTTNAFLGNINNTVTGLGSVSPVYTAYMSSRVTGQIINVDYIEGQIVKSNDLLAVIDPRPYQAAVVQEQGQLAHDRATLAKDKIDLERYRNAAAKNAIPIQTYQDQEQTVHQDEGTVKSDEGLVSNAQVNLDYCYIRAPFNGRVGLRLIDPGNVVNAGNTNALVIVAQLQPITVMFTVAEDFLPQIQRQVALGHTMTVEAWDRDWTRKLADGAFLTTDNQIDPATGTIRIRAVFPNEEMTLFPNQFVNVRLIINTLDNVTLVPTAAIQHDPQGAFLYIVDNSSTVRMVQVNTGLSENELTQVTGVEPGAQVVTDNFNRLGENMKVITRSAMASGRSEEGASQNAKKHRHKSGQGQDNAQ